MARLKYVNHNQLILNIIGLVFIGLILVEHLAEAGKSKGRDIIIYNGKVIVKGGKKKGNIIISHGDSHEGGHGGQGGYKYKKKYMNYGGYWK